MAARHRSPGQLLRPREPLRLACRADLAFANFCVTSHSVTSPVLTTLPTWLWRRLIGVIVDKFGVRFAWVAPKMALWSVATFGGALAPSLGALFGARFLLGIGEAPTFPACAKAVGHWFPPHERSLPTALFDSAAKLSSVIAIPAVGFILLKAGWRWGFATTGTISLLYFIYFWRVYRDPDEDAALTDVERRYIASGDRRAGYGDEAGSSLWRLLGNRKVLGLALGFGSYNYIFYLLLTWLPSYFAFALHIDLMHSFLYTSVPWLVATVCELVIGGWLVDFLVKRGVDANPRVRRVVLIGGARCGLALWSAARAHTAAQALMWISLSISGLSAHAAVGWSLPSLIASRTDVGKVGGIVNFSNQVSGVCAPIVTGYLVTALHSYAWVFGVSAIYLAIGICGYVFLLGRIEQPVADSR